MIEVLLFASLKQAVGHSPLSVALTCPLPVAQLKAALALEHPSFQRLHEQGLLNIAVNQQIAEDDWLIAQGDEVAAFPPVTGG